MTTTRRLCLSFVVAVVLAAASVSAWQYDPFAALGGLKYRADRQVLMVNKDVPDTFRFCAGSVDGVLKGCVTAKELRTKAMAEK